MSLHCPLIFAPYAFTAQFLKRKVFQSTLGELSAMFDSDPSAYLFVKPAGEAKAFNGECINGRYTTPNLAFVLP